jgi:hypothetical protein
MGVMDTMMSGTAPGFTFERPGDTIEGVVVELDARQDHVFNEPTKLKWWNRDPGPATGSPDDRPIMIPIFVLETSLRDSDEDDGRRSVWARQNAFTAIRQAIRGAFGSKKPTDDDVIGGTLKVRFDSVGEPTKKGFQGPKLFRAKFTKKSVLDTPQDDFDAPTQPRGQAQRPGPTQARNSRDTEGPIDTSAPPPADW